MSEVSNSSEPNPTESSYRVAVTPGISSLPEMDPGESKYFVRATTDPIDPAKVERVWLIAGDNAEVIVQNVSDKDERETLVSKLLSQGFTVFDTGLEGHPSHHVLAAREKPQQPQ